MKKQEHPQGRERQIRFVEATILFVLLLGVTVFVGVGLRGGEEEITPTATATAGMTEIVNEPVVEPAPEATAAEAEPAVEVETVTEPETEPEPVAYEQAEAAYHEGRYVEATDLFARYASENPENVWGLYMLGLSAWKTGDTTAADEAFAEARALQPEHLKSLVNHARVLLEMDRDNEAQAAVSAALALAPLDLGANRVQARIHHRQGRLDDAVATYRDVLRTNGDDAWALNNLGLILIEQERFEEALAPLAKASGLAAAACIQNNLGVALERTGHYRAAAEAYAAALEIAGEHDRAETSLARVDGLVEDPALVPVDLAALADGFAVDPVDPADGGEGTDVALAAVMTEPETAPADPETSENDDDGIR